jgi:hypothetical protein
MVRAVIRTFQDMAAEFSGSVPMRKRGVALPLYLDKAPVSDPAFLVRAYATTPGRRPALRSGSNMII